MLPPLPMHLPHHGRAAVAAGALVQGLEVVEVVGVDARALGQQALEDPRFGPKRCSLPHQRPVPLQGLAEGRAQRHCLAFIARPFAQRIPGRQNLGTLRREGVHRRAVAPAGDRVADVPCDTLAEVVVRRGVGVGRAGLPHAVRAGPAAAHRFPGIAPRAVRDVVERRLLGLGARPALRQIPTDFRVRHRHVGIVLRPPLGDIEGQGRAVDVDVDPLPVPGRGGIDGLPCRPVVHQQEGAVHRQTLGRGDGHGVAVVEANVAAKIADLVVAEGNAPAVVGARGDENRGLVPQLNL